MHRWTFGRCRGSRHKSSNIPFPPIIQGGENGPVIMLIHTNCVSREKRREKSGEVCLTQKSESLHTEIWEGDAFMILIQFPLPQSNSPSMEIFLENFSFPFVSKWNKIWDLRVRGVGRVIVKHICPCFYQYLLNNFTNIQIRPEKFISQIRSHPKWSRVLLLKEKNVKVSFFLQKKIFIHV